MFTGIITDIGTVAQLAERATGTRLRISSRYDSQTIGIGASIACSGVCLTVVATEGTDGGCIFDVEASPETLARTTIGTWQPGSRINLERALRAGDELGGHIVSGHVDGLASILDRADDNDMARFTLAAPAGLARFIATKGSVALDGTSLTVNSVNEDRFDIMLIPHSLQKTNWGEKRAGDQVNLEVDMFARYLERLNSYPGEPV